MSLIEEIWDIQINLNLIEENNYIDFQAKVVSLHEHVLNIIENGFRVNKSNFNNSVPQNHDELKTIIERNKQLRHDIDKKVEELSQQKLHYEKYKNGIYLCIILVLIIATVVTRKR